MPCLDPSHRMAQRLASSLISGASLSENQFPAYMRIFCNSPPPRPLYARLHLSVRLPYHWPLPPICLHKALKRRNIFCCLKIRFFNLWRGFPAISNNLPENNAAPVRTAKPPTANKTLRAARFIFFPQPFMPEVIFRLPPRRRILLPHRKPL